MAFKGYDMYVKIGVDRNDMDKDLDKVEKDLKKSKLLKNKLLTKLGVDPKEFDEKMEKAHKKVEKLTAAVKKVGTTMGSALGKVGKFALDATTTALKTTTAALGGAVAGVVALAKQSYSAYAEYQQLVGGVQKLYGNMNMSLEDWAAQQHKTVEEARADYERNAEAEKYIMDKAKNAFATTGMSANKYMETATQFSANLVASYGGDTLKAAEETDKAMRQISDNWNTFGGDIAEIEHAYKGFAKQNYTMLDNLHLPYSGTKEEMERLIADAEKLDSTFKAARDQNGDYAMSFNDIIDAIGIVQDDLQISGTTARESASTIAGSFGSLKAAWENLVTGFADPNADLGELINNVVTTAGTALKNAVPTVVRALGGIATAVKELVPIIGQELPGLVKDVLPQLLEAASSLVQALAGALPGLIDVLAKELPPVLNTLIPVAIEALITVFTAISNALPDILKVIEDNIDVISSGIFTIMSTVGEMLLEALPLICDMIVKWLPKALEFIQKNIGKLTSSIGKVLSALGGMLVKLFPIIFPQLMTIAVDLLKQLTKYSTENANQIISGIMEIVFVIVETLTNPDTLGEILHCALEIIFALAEGILNNLDQVLAAVGALIVNITTFLVESIPELVEEIGKNGAKIITDVIPNLLIKIGEAGGELLGKIIETLGGWWEDIAGKATEVFFAIGDGLLGAWDYVTGKISEFGEWVWGGLEDIFSGMWEFGKGLGTKIWNGLKSMFGKLRDALNPKNWFSGGALDVGEMAVDMVVKQGYSEEQAQESLKILKEQGEDAAKAYLDGQKKGYDVNSPSKKMRWLGQMVMGGFSLGLSDEAEDAVDPFTDITEKVNSLKMDEPEIAFGVQSKIGGTNEVQTSRINDLIELMRGYMTQEQEIVIPVYVAGRQVDEILVSGKNRITTRSGGQVNV